MGERSGLRERKKQQVRRTLLEVCGRLFRSEGYDRTTIDRIVREAGISRQTFFNYFPSKDAVLAELGAAWLEAQTRLPQEGLRAGRPASVFEGIRHAIAGQLRAIERDRDFMRLVFTRSGLLFPHGPQVGTAADEARLDPTRRFFAALAALVRAGQEAGRIRRDVAPEQAAEIYVAVLLVTIRLWLTGYWDEPGDLVGRGMKALDVLEAGFRADGGGGDAGAGDGEEGRAAVEAAGGEDA